MTDKTALTSNRKNVPDFFGRLYPTDLVNGSFLGTWVRRSEVDALLDEIEERRAELQRVYKLVNHWSGQEKRLRAALESIGEYDCPGGVHPKHCPGCAACDANKALSGDSSAPETKATVELAADTIRALMERHNFRHPLMSELGDLIRETFRMGVDAGRCYHSPQETSTPRCHFMAFRDPQFRCTKPAGHTDEHSCGLAPATEPVEKATALQRELSEGAHADWVAGAMGLVDACAERASEPVVEPAPHRHYTVTKEEQDDLDRIAAAEKASEQECRSAGPSGNAAGTGLVDRQAEARLSRREITAQKASADCTGCGGKPEFPNIPCSICGRYPDGTSV